MLICLEKNIKIHLHIPPFLGAVKAQVVELFSMEDKDLLIRSGDDA